MLSRVIKVYFLSWMINEFSCFNVSLLLPRAKFSDALTSGRHPPGGGVNVSFVTILSLFHTSFLHSPTNFHSHSLNYSLIPLAVMDFLQLGQPIQGKLIVESAL